MQTGMLGNNESLRVLLQGPISDLFVKLNGEKGQEVLTELNKFNRQEPCWVPKQEKTQIEESPHIPTLRSTGHTLADWLKAREELHRFFIGELVILRDLFSLTDEELASTTLMPAFRPAGATNRHAIEWKLKMGENKPYEETDVMKYTNSKGQKEPELYLINRSVKPDDDTLSDYAKSPDQLVKIQNKLWLGLFGWCDADTMHHVVTGEHLDPETWTWFPEDRLRGGEVAYGYWHPGYRKVYLYWSYAGSCNPSYGARSAKKVPLRS
ncbi:MAG: hypothetical protein Q8R17_01800 [bacterium]|nr:hypothetical protein [bacterium]